MIKDIHGACLRLAEHKMTADSISRIMIVMIHPHQ